MHPLRTADGGTRPRKRCRHELPHCAAPLTVPRIPPNPYLRPIKNIVRQMKGVPLPFPYLPQLIQLAVLTSVLALFGIRFMQCCAGELLSADLPRATRLERDCRMCNISMF